MRWLSFRQGLLAGFLIVVLLLGGVGIHGWLLLEGMVAQSRESNAQALQLSTAVQALGERSVDIERSARQYLVLGDALLRERFDAHLAGALEQLVRIEAMPAETLVVLSGRWREQAGMLRDGIEQTPPRNNLAEQLDRLAALNDEIQAAAKRWIDGGNVRLLDQLERRRVELGSRLALALLGAVLVAMAMGWWLVRAVRQLEKAIGRLGEGRFDASIEVSGPADLRRLGRHLDGLRNHLAGLEADRERTLRHVSHELKTPLTALKEGIALLAEEVPGPLSEGQREVTRILGHKVDSLQCQIESLLRLNAAVFEARRLNLLQIDLRQVLSEAAQRHELRGQARQVRIEVEAGEGRARLDPGKLAVILDNLLANAIDFSPQGGVVRLTAQRLKGGWRIVCRDQGPGVAPEDVQRIFEPFVQGRRAAPVARGGSGVGLSIVRELAQAMRARIRLADSDVGAVFQLDLPDEK